MSATPSEHLRVTSPSATAVKYTISSRTREPSKLLVTFKHSLRIIVAFYTLLATVAKLRSTFYAGISQHVEQLLASSFLSRILYLIIENVEWWVLCFTSLITLYLCIRRDYTEESLLVLQGLGIQTSTSSSYFLLGPTTTFIPTNKIQDIVINEAFKGFEVRFFFAIIVVETTEVVVVFPRLLPRRTDLEIVWRGSRKCLYGNRK